MSRIPLVLSLSADASLLLGMVGILGVVTYSTRRYGRETASGRRSVLGAGDQGVLAAASVSAWRATRLDPAETLRSE